MSKDLRDFPFRIAIHERRSAGPVLDWLDKNIRKDRWTMGVRNIELQGPNAGAPYVDMMIYFARREDMELFREVWSGKARQRKIKLKFWRAALFALLHPRAEMVFYEDLQAQKKPKGKPGDEEKDEVEDEIGGLAKSRTHPAPSPTGKDDGKDAPPKIAGTPPRTSSRPAKSTSNRSAT